jgi:ABC-2 type transport system permease protein
VEATLNPGTQSKNASAGKLERDRRARSTGFSALYRKELADHAHSARFYIVFALLALTSAAAIAGALNGLKDAIAQSPDFAFLKLFTTSGNSIPSFASFLAYLAPLTGIVLGFDAISAERSQGTLNRLASQPIYRDTLIIAKFMAGFTVILVMMLSLGVMVAGVGLATVGIVPEPEEIARALVYLLYSAIYTSLWLALAILFSVLLRHAATSALISISVWIYMTLFASMVGGIIANLIFPVNGITGLANILNNYMTSLYLSRVSPYNLYIEAITIILNPNMRALFVTSQTAVSGAIASYLSLDQSLLLIWPHLTAMLAVTLLLFGIAYIRFIRQEIRA